jgi:outer membrane protein OmpA-like peptidoglycan-associated protein
MSENLIDIARRLLTPEVTAKAAAATGEPSGRIDEGLQAAVPTILAGLGQQASRPGGLGWVIGLLKEGLAGGEAGEEGGGPLELEQRGQTLARNLFGDRSTHVTEALASQAGIRTSSASQVLALAGPLVAGVVGGSVVSRRLNASGLTALLTSQRDAVLRDAHTPPELIAAMMGGGPPPEVAGASRIEPHRGAAPRRRPVGRGVVLLVAAALAAWVIFALARGRSSRPGATEMQPQGTQASPQTQPAPQATPAPQSARTPQTPQTALPSEDARKVERAASDPSVPLPYTASLDELTFERGSFKLRPEANAPLSAVAAVLLSHPSVRVRIDGHADSAGDQSDNRTLSESRARAVKNALEEMGVAGDRIEVAGHGADQPAVGNQTEQGRASNRRTQIVILSR